MAQNLLAQLRPEHVTVRCFDHTWKLQALTAIEWIGAVGVDIDNLSGVFPGLIEDDDVERMWGVMQSTPDINDRWARAARMALQYAGGRDWWWSWNMIRKALHAWTYFNGTLILKGVQPAMLSLPDWLDACYMMLIQHCDEQGRIKLNFELQALPAGVKVRKTRADVEREAMAFAAD